MRAFSVPRKTSSPRLVRAMATETSSETKLVGPKPQRFAVAEGQLSNIGTAALPAVFRLGQGALVAGYSVGLKADDGKYGVLKVAGQKVAETSTAISGFQRPAKPLILYQFHACPYCKLIREACNYLDLDVLIKPTPKDGKLFRPESIARGGKKQFPFLIDENTGKEMYESADIVKYLFNTYGPGEQNVPLPLRSGPLIMLGALVSFLCRQGKGAAARPSKVTAETKPIVFWGYEASPFSVIVQERLTELEVPYLWKTCARGSPKRQELLDKRGHFQVPYIEDPNTGVAMFESKDICDYLTKTYQA